MLKLASAEPVWLEIMPAAGEVPAVRLLLRPITRQAFRAAQAAVSAALAAAPQDVVAAGDDMGAALLRAGIVDWEGVGDAAGELLACTPETVEMFLSNADAFTAADRAYVMPWVNRNSEKNVSSGSPNGTLAGATPGKITAGSPAAGKPKAAANRTRKGRGPART
jgi:hypothetical protein